MNNTSNSAPLADAAFLSALRSELSTAARRRLLATVTERRRGMAGTETPGHAFWYPLLLEQEEAVAGFLGLPLPADRQDLNQNS